MRSADLEGLRPKEIAHGKGILEFYKADLTRLLRRA